MLASTGEAAEKQVQNTHVAHGPHHRTLSIPIHDNSRIKFPRDLKRIRSVLCSGSLRESGYNFNLVTRVRNRPDRGMIHATVRTLTHVRRHNTVLTSNGANSNYNLLLRGPSHFFHVITRRHN